MLPESFVLCKKEDKERRSTYRFRCTLFEDGHSLLSEFGKVDDSTQNPSDSRRLWFEDVSQTKVLDTCLDYKLISAR